MGMRVCVTGADRGLGYALTEQLLKDGHTVFAGRYLKEWKALEGLKDSYTDTLHNVDLDIGDGESVKAAVGSISEFTDGLDVLVNNAGILGDTQATALDELDFAQMQRVYDVNALGPLRVTNALLPLLLVGLNKLIVNISSEAGSISASHRVNWFGYCMSKAALNMQSTMVHNLVRDQGGQVMVVHPGWVKSYMSGKLNEKATYTASESAAGIVRLIADHKAYMGDKPAYLDFMGESLEW